MVDAGSAERWADELFQVSLLKQQKLQAISALLPRLEGLRCLDVGGDNGVISMMLRRLGGSWTSADLDRASVEAIEAVVHEHVALLEGVSLPFADRSLDCIVLADCLEHMEHDAEFVREVSRVLVPGGTLIANVPLSRDGLLRRLRLSLGQTDALHGHVRPGYTHDELANLLSGTFCVDAIRDYSGFFSQLVDTFVVAGVRLLGAQTHGVKGTVVTRDASAKSIRMARIFYPVMWIFAQLDRLIFGSQGYMLIASAHRREQSSCSE